MRVPILKQRDYLIASIQAALMTTSSAWGKGWWRRWASIAPAASSST
jgi:hypothetical protein